MFTDNNFYGALALDNDSRAAPSLDIVENLDPNSSGADLRECESCDRHLSRRHFARGGDVRRCKKCTHDEPDLRQRRKRRNKRAANQKPATSSSRNNNDHSQEMKESLCPSSLIPSRRQETQSTSVAFCRVTDHFSLMNNLEDMRRLSRSNHNDNVGSLSRSIIPQNAHQLHRSRFSSHFPPVSSPRFPPVSPSPPRFPPVSPSPPLPNVISRTSTSSTPSSNGGSLRQRSSRVETRGAACCGICTDSLPYASFMYLTCGHSYCRKCLAKWLKSHLDKGVLFELPCPSKHECGQNVTSVRLWELANAGAFAQRLQESLKKARDMEQRGLNPKQESSSWSSKIISESKSLFFKDGSLLWIKHNAKRCPRCWSPIEKNRGCSHIHCTICGVDFCWDCMQVHNNAGRCGCRGPQLLTQEEQRLLYAANMFTQPRQQQRRCQRVLCVSAFGTATVLGVAGCAYYFCV